MKRKFSYIGLILFSIIVILTLVLYNVNKLDHVVNIAFLGESEPWKVEYVELSETNGKIQVSLLTNISDVEFANHIEVRFDLGHLSGSSSLNRFDSDPPFSESQLKAVFQIPVFTATQRIRDPIIIVVVDDQIFEVPLLKT